MPGWDDAADSGWGDGAKATSTWDTTGADEVDSSAFVSNDEPAGFTDDFDNADPALNRSKHADGDGDDRGPMICRNCNEPGHPARECPEPKKMTGECFNCGEIGHNKADCPNPKVERPFTGTCRHCEKEGHRAAECPDKPPDICKNCLGTGHKAADCDLARVLDRTGVPEKTEDEAWEMLKQAADERDMDDFKLAIQILAKANPKLTYYDIEKQFRAKGLDLYLVAVEGECPNTLTRVNLQGKSNCDYNIVYSFTGKQRRTVFQAMWPASAEANMERLENAGEPMRQVVPVCLRCNELGHISKNCDQERLTPDTSDKPKCENCGSEDHRIRDCTEERLVKPRRGGGDIECRRCNELGHMAKDCPNAGSGGGDRACRNCGEEGHMAKECDKPRDPSTMTCRNCDQVGHMSRECPEPKNWSKVKCQNCGEMGHGKARCDKPPAAADDDDADAGGFDNLSNIPDSAAAADWAAPPIPAGGNASGW